MNRSDWISKQRSLQIGKQPTTSTMLLLRHCGTGFRQTSPHASRPRGCCLRTMQQRLSYPTEAILTCRPHGGRDGWHQQVKCVLALLAWMNLVTQEEHDWRRRTSDPRTDRLNEVLEALLKYMGSTGRTHSRCVCPWVAIHRHQCRLALCDRTAVRAVPTKPSSTGSTKVTHRVYPPSIPRASLPFPLLFMSSKMPCIRMVRSFLPTEKKQTATPGR